MSIARHHTEWLSLVPVSGPFLSLPVLMEAFNAGLEPHDPEHNRLLRQAYADWLQWIEQRTADPVPHREWIKFVLNRTLDLDERVLLEGQAIPQTLDVEIPEHRELLRPSMVVCAPNTKKTRMLVQTYPRSQELTSYVANSPWKASPDTRMTELLHGSGVRLGLVTNGEHWMLVDAPKGETTGYASWYASLWLEEPITLRAFRSLLSASRFFNVPDDQTLESLLAKSASNQQEVTDQLGYQVRRAVEVLIHSLDRADQDFGRELLADVTPEQLYESALTVMMRLVFLFCAEERELIPSKPFPVYEQNYSVSTISKQLRELADQHGEELLERRYDAWPRLLAAFRAVPVRGDGASSRVYALESTVGYSNAPGTVQTTGRPLDVAVKGNSWLAVQALDGTEAYTRAGALEVNAEGLLTDVQGRPVVGDGGPLTIPANAEVEVASDGTVSAKVGRERPQPLGRLKLVTPEAALQRGTDGLFRAAEGDLAADPAARLQSGALEGSNVNAVESMVAMIAAARQFEQQMKALQTAEQKEQSATKLLSPQ